MDLALRTRRFFARIVPESQRLGVDSYVIRYYT